MTTKHYATQDFRDAGTERSFKQGEVLTDLKAEEIHNYTTAGLASKDAPKPATKPADDGKAA